MLLIVPCVSSAQDLRLLFSIGQESAPNYTFARIRQLAVDGARNVYVLDTGDMAVKVYDAQGRFVARMGREGSGPGEFLAMGGLQVTESEVRVTDARQNRISRFDHLGRHLQTTPLVVPQGMNVGRIWPLRGGGRLLQTVYRASIGSESHDPFVHILFSGLGDTPPDTLLTYEPAIVLWYTPGGPAPWGGLATQLGDGGALAVAGDSVIALIDGYQGMLELRTASRTGLGPARTVDLGVRGQPFPSRARETLRDSMREARKNPRIDVMVPAQQSAISGQCFFDDRGHVWVEKAVVASTVRQWLRVDSQTGTITTVTVPAHLAVLAVRDGRLYGIWTDELDVQTVRVYQVATIGSGAHGRHPH
jgi:hypothetical protein